MTTAVDQTETDGALFHEPDLEEQEDTSSEEEPAAERLGRALGLFSIGLGMSQILAPRGIARAIGLRRTARNHRIMMAFGLREVATGLGLITRPQSAALTRGRIAGDAMDLAVLGQALSSGRNHRNRVALAMAAVAGVTVLDLIAGRKLSQPDQGPLLDRRDRRRIRIRRAIRVKKAITVNRSPQEAYSLWRNFENLPRFMAHLDSVRMMDTRRSYWRAKAPLGATVEWVAEITDDRPGELIGWRSLEGADVSNAGQVRFVPAPRGGTEVHVELHYDPPGGIVGATFAKLFGEEPSVQVDSDLRRFKQVLEIGEVVHSDSSVHGGRRLPA